MNIKEIKELINLMNENDLTEFEMERDGLRIRLKKGTGGAIEGGVERVVVPAGLVQGAPPSKESAVQTAEIKAPIVGTFYRAPSTDAPPFVEVGSKIDVGQVVCIIEAMKLMNEIKSEVKGKVAEILVGNGDPVEYGTILFLIELA